MLEPTTNRGGGGGDFRCRRHKECQSCAVGGSGERAIDNPAYVSRGREFQQVLQTAIDLDPR